MQNKEVKYFFIVNPVAGKGKKADTEKLLEYIGETVKEAGCDYEIHITESVGDAKKYVGEKCVEFPDKELRFIAFGGDGTFNEVASGTIPYENASVGSFPHGTGNDYIKSFTQTQNFKDLKAQLNGKVIPLDVLKCNDIYCINIVNIGFDCDVAKKMSAIKTSPLVPSKAAYMIAVVTELFKKLGKHIKITLDDTIVIDGVLLLSAYGVGRFYGGGFKALPNSQLDDGYMDVCIADKVNLPQFFKIIGTYKKGEHIVNGESVIPFIHSYRCKKAIIKPDYEVGVCYDGEIMLSDKIHIEILPLALRFIVPDGSELIR